MNKKVFILNKNAQKLQKIQPKAGNMKNKSQLRKTSMATNNAYAHRKYKKRAAKLLPEESFDGKV